MSYKMLDMNIQIKMTSETKLSFEKVAALMPQDGPLDRPLYK